MESIRIREIVYSKYVLTLLIVTILPLSVSRHCIAGYDGLLVNFNFPQEISYTPGRLINQKVTFTVKNTGDQTWTACQVSDFPTNEYIPAYKIEITNLSWNANYSYTNSLIGSVEPGESDHREGSLGENFLPTEPGVYSFKMESYFHNTNQCKDDFRLMKGNNPATIHFTLSLKPKIESMPWLPLLLLDYTVTDPDSPYEISFAYLQYRNYPTPSDNRYSSWIGLTKEGKPVSESDVVNFKITDSFGNELVPVTSGFYRSSPYYFYNCNTIPCTEEADIIDSGFSANFNLIPAGDYEIVVEAADGHNFTAEIYFAGQLILPFISNASMQSYWSNGDLVLSWTNPTNEKNWDKVSQLRIIMYAEDNAEVLYIRTNPSTTTVTIPASLYNDVVNLGHGIITGWLIQTRAYDSNNMNSARGYSH